MTDKPLILVADDETRIRRLVVESLENAGFDVCQAQDGRQAVDVFRLSPVEPDLVILDLMMPEMDGEEALKAIRKTSAVPVLILTARDFLCDKSKCFNAGADDYLVKPFSFDELLARLRVVTRKRGGSATNVFTVADLTVDTASHHVKRGGRTISLSAKEFALLEYMIRNRGIVLSRERIENHLWNYDYSGGSNVVDVYVSYLRRKIDADYPTKLIHTVWGVGWVLREEV